MFPALEGCLEMQLKIISFVPIEYHAVIREVLRGVPARPQDQDQETLLGMLVEQRHRVN